MIEYFLKFDKIPTMAKKATILPFQILIKENSISFEGQILHVSKKSETSTAEDSAWKNIKRTIDFYTPKKINKTSRLLKVELGVLKYEIPIDKFGYFNFEGSIDSKLIENTKSVRFYLGQDQIFFSDSINLKPLIAQNGESKLGVISDIDDTIIVSHSTSALKKSTTLTLKNIYSRKAILETKEILEYYKTKDCDFFYVSNSETNLYIHIKTFLQLNDFPDGPVFTKKLKTYRNLFIPRKTKGFFAQNRHKINRIESIFENYRNEKYILIGDSSQNDPEIYFYISQKFPDKVEKIYIRDITKRSRRKDLIEMKDNLAKRNIEMYFY
jgi:phosphatidate phosphatase APP1